MCVQGGVEGGRGEKEGGAGEERVDVDFGGGGGGEGVGRRVGGGWKVGRRLEDGEPPREDMFEDSTAAGCVLGKCLLCFIQVSVCFPEVLSGFHFLGVAGETRIHVGGTGWGGRNSCEGESSPISHTVFEKS